MEAPRLPYAKEKPVKEKPAKATPTKVSSAFLILPDPVDELKMDALTVAVKATYQCPKCKKTYKKDGACLQTHIEKCGTLGYVDPDDTISDGGTGMG